MRGPSVNSPVSWIVPDETGRYGSLQWHSNGTLIPSFQFFSCSTSPLRNRYVDRTIVLTLPDEITIHDFDWFLIWCVPFRINFGEVRIPDNIELVEQIVEFPTLPPIVECTMVGITHACVFHCTQNQQIMLFSTPYASQLEPEVPVNCQQLTEDITVSWSINSLSNTIVFQLCGCVLVRIYQTVVHSEDELMCVPCSLTTT